MNRVRVLVWYRCPGGAAAVAAAFRAIGEELAGTPGLLCSELLRAGSDVDTVAVMSEWESAAAFRRWEEGTSHRSTTAPLRRYRHRGPDRPYEIYEVAATASYPADRVRAEAW